MTANGHRDIRGERSPELRRYRLAVLLVALGVPFAIAAVGTALMISWLPELPDPVAIHWGLDGADGFGSPWITIALMPVLLLAFAALGVFAALSSGGSSSSSRGTPLAAASNGRFMAAISVGFSAFIAVLLVGTLVVQRGLADATASDLPILPSLAIGLGAGVLLATAAWFLVPRLDVATERAAAGPGLDLAPGEAPFWTADARSSTVTVAVPLLLTLGTIVLMIVVGAPWVFTALVVLVLLIAVSLLLPWRVSADARGLRVVAATGLLRFRVPLDDVARAGVVEVVPMRDFGGWGIRLASGRFGVITRRGEALRVERHSAKSAFVVTVDDAETGAAVLNGLVAR